MADRVCDHGGITRSELMPRGVSLGRRYNAVGDLRIYSGLHRHIVLMLICREDQNSEFDTWSLTEQRDQNLVL